MGFGSILGGIAGFALGGPAGAAIGASIGGGVDSSSAAKKAARSQSEAALAAGNLEQARYLQAREDQEPYREAGASALEEYRRSLMDPGAAETSLLRSPGYEFRFSEGQKALERGAAARRNRFSGATAKGLLRYGQDYASGEYGNYMGRLANLAGIGQTATQQTGALGGAAARGQAGSIMDAGTARASGYVGQQNAQNAAIQNVLGSYLSQQQSNSRFTTANPLYDPRTQVAWNTPRRSF